MHENTSNPPQHGGPQFGLILALMTQGLAISDYPDLVQVSTLAESYGFDSVWLCDHFSP